MAKTAPDPGSEFASALAELNVVGPVGLAVSGGGDSMALLALAQDWATRSDQTLAVATVDHGLRRESRAEAEFVAGVCAESKTPHSILTISDLDGPGNLSARARSARYDVLSEWADRVNAGSVLLGHTMDDQAETVLMRLARGSGAEGLSGMAAQMTWNGVQFLRPLLGVRRASLRNWLKDRNLRWVEDPTNEDQSYDRVKARDALALLEPLGITVEGLSATSDRLARQRKVLQAAADDLIAQAVVFEGSSAILERSLIRLALPDTALRVIASVLQRVGGNPYRPRFRALEPLYQRLMSHELTTVTLAHCLIHLKSTQILIEPE